MIQRSFLLLLVLMLSGCSQPAWQSRVIPSETAVATALDDQPDPILLRAVEFQDFTLARMPEDVRPCCAFGNAHRVKVGSVQVPFFRYANTVALDDIGPHSYEAGTFSLERSDPNSRRKTENNGQIYTRRGGFIDLAHVRDTADNAIALFYRIYPRLGEAQEIELPAEIGPRVINLSAFDASHLDPNQRWEVATAIAVRQAYFMAEAHEIAQWSGYRSWAPWSETVSAYSPEDIYSNMLGAKIALALLNNNLALTRELYNQHMTTWLYASLDFLEPVSRAQTDLLFDITDGHWWDSEQALPSKFMLLKRHYLLGDQQNPHLVPESLAMKHPQWEQVADLYQQASDPHPLSLQNEIHGIDIDAISEQRLWVDPKYQSSFSHIPEALWRDGFNHHDFKYLSSYNQQQDELELKAFRKAGKKL